MKQNKSILYLIILGAASTLILLGVAVKANHAAGEALLSVIRLAKGAQSAVFWSTRLPQLSFQIIITGIVLLMAGWLVVAQWEKIKAWKSPTYLAPTIIILLLLGLMLPVIGLGHSTVLEGERYWWLGDDAMISMRYAHNFARGEGLVWNAGERVEGYTNFLWTLYMSLVHVLPVSTAKTSLVILLTNMAIALATVLVIFRLTKELGGGSLAIWAALVGFALCKDEMYWTTLGFETTLLTFFILCAVLLALEDSRREHVRFLTCLVIAVISLIRADAFIFSMLLYGLVFFIHRDRKTTAKYLVLSLLLPLSHVVFRMVYYGELLPNTAYLKAMNWEGKYAAGIAYVFSFLKSYLFPVCFAVMGALILRRKLFYMLLTGLGVYTAYVAFVGGDVFPNFRFFVPVIPLLLILAFVGIENLKVRVGLRWACLMLGLITIPLIFPNYTAFLSPERTEVGNLELGLFLKRNTPPDCRIADTWAGSVFYFCDRYAIDLLGKSDRYIAGLKAASNSMLPGHNKFDFNYSLGVLKPDIVVANFKLPVSETRMRVAARGNYAFTGQLYFNSTFHDHYLGNPLNAPTWRSIFARDSYAVNDGADLFRNWSGNNQLKDE